MERSGNLSRVPQQYVKKLGFELRQSGSSLCLQPLLYGSIVKKVHKSPEWAHSFKDCQPCSYECHLLGPPFANELGESYPSSTSCLAL